MTGWGNGGYGNTSDMAVARRMRSLKGLLGILSALPAVEPDPTLGARTVQYCELVHAATGVVEINQPQRPAQIDG